jgi:hypothetical protein
MGTEEETEVNTAPSRVSPKAPPVIQCMCSHHEWGCVHNAEPASSHCRHCKNHAMSDQEECNCECLLCTDESKKGAKVHEWRCQCTHHGSHQCVLPAHENGYCASCDPFEHGWCICSCCTCSTAQKLEDSSKLGNDTQKITDVIERDQCACISANGIQCVCIPMPSREFCYDCSAGYCDCECNGCQGARMEYEQKPVCPAPDAEAACDQN